MFRVHGIRAACNSRLNFFFFFFFPSWPLPQCLLPLPHGQIAAMLIGKGLVKACNFAIEFKSSFPLIKHVRLSLFPIWFILALLISYVFELSFSSISHNNFGLNLNDTTATNH